MRSNRMNKLTINNIDHSKFDLEWAKRGGVLVALESDNTRINPFKFLRSITSEKIEVSTMSQICFVTNFYEYRRVFRMATPDECAEAGIEYVDPPMRWRPIETAPESTYTWPWCQDDKPDKLSERDWESYDIKVSRIIACDSDGFVTEAYNWFGKWYYVVFSGEFHKPMEIKPVKWMPLPQPPKDE